MRHLPLFFFYFSLGTVFQFPQVALRVHLIDNLNVSPAALTGFYGIMAFPWFAKPFYAFFSDSFPMCGYHKRPYIVTCSLLCSCIWFCMLEWHESVISIITFLTASSFMLCVCDVIVDGVMVQQAQLEDEDSKGKLQSRCRAARASGTLFASLLGPWVSTQWGVGEVCFMTAMFPLANSLTCLLLEEPRAVAERDPVCHTIRSLWTAFRSRDIFKMSIFVFVSSLVPGYYMSLTFYLQTKRNFSAMTFGELDVAYSASVIVGSLLFSKFFRDSSPKCVICTCICVSFCLRMLQLLLVFHINDTMGIRAEWFVGLEAVAFSAVGTIANMPIAILCARMSPVGLEATFFASMMSLSNIGGGLSSLLSSLMTTAFGVTREHFETMWQLIITCNIMGLMPLLLIRLLPNTRAHIVPQYDTEENTENKPVEDEIVMATFEDEVVRETFDPVEDVVTQGDIISREIESYPEEVREILSPKGKGKDGRWKLAVECEDDL